MPSLKNLTENALRKFAGEVIFKRGLDYFEDKMVHQNITYSHLMEYYEWGNCGIVDYIAEAAEKICPQSK